MERWSRRRPRRSRSAPSTCSTSTPPRCRRTCRVLCSKGTYVRQLAIDIGRGPGRRRLRGQPRSRRHRPVSPGRRPGVGRSSKKPSRARDSDDEHIPGLVSPVSGPAVHARGDRHGGPGGSRAQRRPAARRGRRTRSASCFAASSSRSTVPSKTGPACGRSSCCDGRRRRSRGGAAGGRAAWPWAPSTACTPAISSSSASPARRPASAASPPPSSPSITTRWRSSIRRTSRVC